MLRKSAILLAVVLGLAGCGGDGDDDAGGGATSGTGKGGADTRSEGRGGPAEAGSDRRRVQAALDRVFKKADDPSNCEAIYTERYVNDSFGKEEQLQECQKQQKELYDEDDRADSVKVIRLDVRGDEAEAAITVTGGFSDGNSYDVKLIREGDVFKLDELEPK